MAEVRVEEAYTERDETIDAKGNVTEVEIPYLVFNVADESAALAAARPKVKTVTGMSLESIEVMERINATTWKVKAVYEVDDGGEQPDDDGGDEDIINVVFSEIWNVYSNQIKSNQIKSNQIILSNITYPIYW